MDGEADDFFIDPGLVVVLLGVAILVALIVLQYRLIARTEGFLRWLAAVPSLILAAFVMLNVIAPSNIWPIALIFWAVIAFGVHFVVWLIVRFIERA
jgi:hypothetical protein